VIWLSAGRQTGLVTWLLKAAAVLPFVMLLFYVGLVVVISWAWLPHGDTKITIENRTTRAVALLQGDDERYRIVVPACGELILGNDYLRSFYVSPSASPAGDAVDIHYTIPTLPDAPTVETLVVTPTAVMTGYDETSSFPPCLLPPGPPAAYDHRPGASGVHQTPNSATTWIDPKVTVSPAASLKDGQTISVTVTGFGIGSQVFISECDSADTVSSRGCGTVLVEETVIHTDATRAGTGTFVVHRLSAKTPTATASVRCTDQCIIVATLGPGYGWAYTPIVFAAK
jgi:hypothetical protein